MTQPPSFEPTNDRQRPSAEGARKVGGGFDQLDEWAQISKSSSKSSARQGGSAKRIPSRDFTGEPQKAGLNLDDLRAHEASRQHEVPPSFAPTRGPRSSAPNSTRTAGQQPRPVGRAYEGIQPPGHAPQQQSSANRAAGHGAFPSGHQTAPESATPGALANDPSTPAFRPVIGRREDLTRPARTRRRRKIHWLRWILLTIVMLVVCAIAWPMYLIHYGNERLTRVDALSGRADTPGTTYLIVGSDRRVEGSAVYDPVTTGERADTIMLLQVPDKGQPSLVSLPRDSWVEIPDRGMGKLNSAFYHGGPELLVRTVEDLSNLTVDHYVEVSMGGVQQLVDAVGGVNLCYDADVDDEDSGMVWTAGCHDVDGTQALAFSRMRKSDPTGDIGRTARQRQVVGKVIDKAISRSTFFSPSKQKKLVGAAAENLTVDKDSGITSLARAGMGLRTAMGADGLMGAPPIVTIAGWAEGQSVVELDYEVLDSFFAKMRDGELTQEDFYQTG